MNPRTHSQPYVNNSLMIRQEIQRFESVHPSIYAIYDMIEAIPDVLTQQQIREHVVCIEDSFVNSQEWTLARAVPDLKLGIVGSIQSGKSALVHRYLTGSYMQEESPEGGRFKKELVNDGQSYLLLIRDEGGSPELQFTHWVDAVIFVFSLENEMSFNAIYSYYAKMAHYRNTNEIPLILVGTQDGISETSPRVIDETRARKLANDLRKCAYYETCATYGLNVERVFQDACVKIVQQRHLEASPSNSRSNTPNHSIPRNFLSSQAQKPYDTHSNSSQSSGGSHTPPTAHTLQQQRSSDSMAAFKTPVNPEPKPRSLKESPAQQVPHMQLHVHPGVSADEQQREAIVKGDFAFFNPNASRLSSSLPNYYKGSTDHEVTPTSTPILSRKSKHKSSFTIRKDKNPSKKEDEILVAKDVKGKKGDGEVELGSGRAIPIKQGYLYKKSTKGLNKE